MLLLLRQKLTIMKKILLLAFLVLGIQNSVGQDKFEKLWNEVEKYELEGKFRSASELVEKINKKAKRLKDNEQIVKGFIYQSKFALLLDENGQAKIVSAFETAIRENDFPVNAILESIYAGLLEQYFERNKYRIRNRTKLANAKATADFEKWDTSTFIEKITEHYQNSVSNEAVLKATPIANFEAILTQSNTSSKYRPTLYDFLAQRAIYYHKMDHRYVSRPKERFYISDPVVLQPTKDFINEKFYTIDSVYSKRPVLKLYQNLEKFHETIDTLAYIDVMLDRLKFSKEKSTLKNKDSLYISSLRILAATYNNHEASTLVNYALASYYFEASNIGNAKNNKALKDFRIKAHSICTDVLEKFPNSDGGLLCNILKSKIEKQKVSITSERYVVPNKPFLTKLQFKSVDRLYLSVFRVPSDFMSNIKSNNRDSIAIDFIKNNNPLLAKFYKLQSKKDYYEYTTEIDLPGIPEGKYLIVASIGQAISTTNQVYGYDILTATKLAILSFENEKEVVYRFLDRETGMPLKRALINLYDDNIWLDGGKTNALGEFSVKRQAEYYNDIRIEVSQDGDTLVGQGLYISRLSNYSDDEDDDEHIAKATIILDRSIYRPGQIMHFKGILTEKKRGQSNVVPNVYTSIIISGANGDELKEFRLKTNEFGSISGEYKIPQNIVTGEFYIEMDEDYGDAENEEDSYWDEIDDFEYSELGFSVEEYKRPKFEVTFNDVKANYKLGDTVAVSGKARAFLGANVSNAIVKYSITRTIESSSNESYYFEASQDITNGETVTASDGSFTIKYVAVPDSVYVHKERPVFSYSVNAAITDINGETQTNEKIVYVGFHNIKADAILDNQWNSKLAQSIIVNTENLNSQPITADVDVSIFKMSEPERILRKKPWDIVELKTIPKDTFYMLFPNERYDESENANNSIKKEKTFGKKFNTSYTNTLQLEDISLWDSGSYMLELKAVDVFQDTVTVIKKFEVLHPNDSYVAKNKLLDYKVQNTQFKIDREVNLKLRTPADSLYVMVEAYYDNKEIYKKMVLIDHHHSIVSIPIQQYYKNKIVVNISTVKFNSLITRQFNVVITDPKASLNISTLSFRNKLIPDQPETWSFKISDTNGENSKAEILASMYDASLDKFKEHNWNMSIAPNIYSYTGAPYLRHEGSFETTMFKNFDRVSPSNMISILKNYHDLNWFGFDFGSITYTNNKYLNYLKLDMKPVKVKEGNISGIITDPSGLPLPGVNVIVKGTNLGTQTDFDGYYTLDAPVGAELVFSYIGFIAEAVAVDKSGTINLSLREDAALLEEVVVSAYSVFNVKTQFSVGLVNLNSKVLLDSLSMKIKGKAAGIEVLKSLAGVTSQVTIRGMASVNKANQALIIVDGVFINEVGSNFEGYNLSSSDFENIEVLNGEAATSLYGSRAKNGVVIITTKKGLDELARVEARDNLKETAFFLPHLTTNEDGEVSFNFTSPQALTRWKFMLMAHNEKLDVGYLEKMAYTQKDLNVIPNVPRFVREKDTIILSAKLSNLTSEALTAMSMLQLYDGVTMNPIDKEIIDFESTKNSNIAPKGNASVSWKLIIPEGLRVLQYKIVAKSGNHTDGESGLLPVLSNRIMITEAKPLWVPPRSTKKIEFDNLKTHNSTSLEHHKFTLEYTSNPAWLAIKSLPYLMEFPHECAEQTFARFYANALAASISEHNPKIKEVFQSWKVDNTLESPLEKNDNLKSILISETPWVRDAATEKEAKARLFNLFETTKLIEQQNHTSNKLRELQMISGGFPWFAGGGENKFITRHIVAGFGHLQKLNIDFENYAKLKPMLTKAIQYLDTEFQNDFSEHVQNQTDSTKVQLNQNTIQYLYARSFFLKSHVPKPDLQKILNIYVRECKNNWLTRPLYEKGMISLFLYRMDEKDTSKMIVDALIEQAVQSDESGMYWKENSNSWFWYQSPIETQALLIEALSEIDYDKDIIDKLKLWLIKNKRTNQWSSTKATTEAIYALLLQGSDWLSVSDNTIISISDEKIKTNKLEATKKESETGYMKVEWKADEIDSKMASIKVANKSDVVGYGGVYWQYFEDSDKIIPSSESPLQIRKAIFLKTSTANGFELIPIIKGTQIKIGDLITVRMEITADSDMEFVHLKDLRASGLEPVDVLSEYKWQDGLGYYQSTKDVATHFFFDKLSKGTYIFEYNLRANNRGNFSNGITTIQSMYAPEFTDHSRGIRIEIKE